MTILLNILIFLITAGLIATTMTQLKPPANYVVSGIVFVVLIFLASRFYSGWFTVGYAAWMILIAGGLLALREFLRGEKKAR